jgi:beta-lactamase regulating signal transducer with metallopeptidase domain
MNIFADAAEISLLAKSWLAGLADVSVKATLVLAAAAGAAWLLRGGSAAARHLVWTAALVGVLSLPALRLVLPDWRVPIDTYVREASVPAPRPAEGPPFAAGSTAPAARVAWEAWALAIWTAGAAFVFGRYVLGVIAVGRVAARSSVVLDPDWMRLIDGVAAQLGTARQATLMRSDRPTVPMTWGPFRPVILLPAGADSWHQSQRRLVLLHEMAHVKRWDCLVQSISQVVSSVFWFHPLVWVASRRLYVERERACDDAVLGVGAKPSDYASLLLEMVRLRPAHNASAAALSLARAKLIESRVFAILDPRQARRPLTRAATAASAAIAALLVLPIAALNPSAKPAATPSPLDAAAAEPVAPAFTPAQRIEIMRLEALASKAFANRDWKRASEIHEQLATFKPRDADLWFRIGYSNRALANYDRSIEAYERAIELGHRQSTAMYNLACAYSMKKENDKAIEWLDRALRSGFQFRDLLKTDRDLNNVRNDPRFESLLGPLPVA